MKAPIISENLAVNEKTSQCSQNTNDHKPLCLLRKFLEAWEREFPSQGDRICPSTTAASSSWTMTPLPKREALSRVEGLGLEFPKEK